jgi:hypothetical protein
MILIYNFFLTRIAEHVIIIDLKKKKKTLNELMKNFDAQRLRAGTLICK